MLSSLTPKAMSVCRDVIDRRMPIPLTAGEQSEAISISQGCFLHVVVFLLRQSRASLPAVSRAESWSTAFFHFHLHAISAKFLARTSCERPGLHQSEHHKHVYV